MFQPRLTRRNAIICNLHRLGCTMAAIAEGFGISAHRVSVITKRGDKRVRGGKPRPWRNACTYHKTVQAYCRDCKRIFDEVPT